MNSSKIIWNPSYPNKVNRVLQLQSLGLPLNPGTIVVESVTIFKKEDSDFLAEARKLLEHWNALIIRTAWKPDQLSSPYFHIRTQSELPTVVSKLKEICNNKSCTHIIMHGEVIDSEKTSERKRYVAGRLMLHPSSDLPKSETLELVSEEYFAKILDMNPKDYENRLARLSKYIGVGSWRVEYKGKEITDHDINLAIARTNSIRLRLLDLNHYLGRVSNCDAGQLTTVIEFTCCKGPENTFIVFDFDYVVPIKL